MQAPQKSSECSQVHKFRNAAREYLCVRSSFFAAREFADLDDLNAQADVWCRGLAADRPCPEQNSLSVREAFAAEAHLLMKLPNNAYPLLERVAVTAGKTPYVRFDLNDYSIPHTHVRRPLTVLADPDEVRIVDGQHILARHVKPARRK